MRKPAGREKVGKTGREIGVGRRVRIVVDLGLL